VRATGAERGEGAARPKNMKLRPASPGPERPRILLIEDDAEISDVILRTLDARGYAVTAVARGQAGLEQLAAAGFDLVILDLLLPDIDGVSLLERLLSLRRHQRVLVVSALSNTAAKVRCLDIGAGDYLAKPFALEELAARVQAGLRAAEAPERHGRYLRDGALTLDLKRRVALCGGLLIPLSSREFSLLEYLLRREGEVCSRKELLEDVWGFTFDPGTNVVDVYVRRLRQKLERIQIETVRNVGYCLVAA
jgi:two-component system OmpR family response regulator